MKKATCLNDIISVNADFKNAINLYLNLNDKDKILSYIPTKSSISMLNTYLESIYYNKNNASILVGPYGKGKSHLLLLVMAIASLDRNEQNEKVLEELKDRIKIADAENVKTIELIDKIWAKKKFLPVIIMSSYSDLNQAFLMALNDALKREELQDITPDTYYSVAIKRIETKEYACAEGDLFLRVCMSDCAETQCLANEDNTKKKMTMELMQDGTLLEDACECELSDRKDTKTKAKCMLYCLLSKLTKKELPWGTLTGIRPTKIARTMLMEGASDEECIDYMKNQMLCGEEKTMLSLDIAKREIKLLDCLNYEDGYSLYVGIAFCPTTCAYCSFTSYPLSRFGDRVDAYLDSIEKEIDYVAEAFKDKKLNTIYIGGGTPTTLEPDQLERLLSKIENSFNLSFLQEWTVEAGRPDSITREKLKTIKRHPVTRISINPQTMKDETLELIGRRHTVLQVKDAFLLAREEGFDNINMDIIVGLPQETKEDVENTLEEIKKLGPDNLTVHSLAIKRAARLNTQKEEYAGMKSVNSESTMELTQDAAEEMGMKPYYLYRQKNMTGNMENVGYAKPGKEGIYNILIMEEMQTIVALGAGAITKAVYPNGRIERCENVKDIKTYLEKTDEMIERKKRLFADWKEV